MCSADLKSLCKLRLRPQVQLQGRISLVELLIRCIHTHQLRFFFFFTRRKPTRVERGPGVQEFSPPVKHHPPVLASTIGQRVVFADAAQSGRLASEIDDDSPAAREIAALAAEIDRLRIARTAP